MPSPSPSHVAFSVPRPSAPQFPVPQLLSSSCRLVMDGLGVLVIHGGEWMKLDKTEEYIGGQGVVIRLRKGDDYHHLKDKLNKKLKIDKYNQVLSIKYYFKNDALFPTVAICDDEDLDEFINLHLEDKNIKAVMYVSVAMKNIGHSTCAPMEDNDCVQFVENRSPVHQFVMNFTPLLVENIEMLHSSRIPDNESLHACNNIETIFTQNPSQNEFNMYEGRGVSCSPRNVGDEVERQNYSNNMLVPLPISSTRNTCTGSNIISESATGELGLSVGQVFDSKSHLVTEIGIYAIRNHFQTKTSKSRKEIVLMKCVHQDCSWRIRANKILGSERFKVTIFNNDHSCDPNKYLVTNRAAKSNVLANAMKMRLVRPGRIYKTKDIIDDCREEFGIELSYTTAYRSKEKALNEIRGTAEESFMKLPSYCHILKEKNPGTVTHIEVDNVGRFKYFFIALGPSLRDFASCMRHVVSIDGSFLSGRYAGTLFVAATSDGNSSTYPIAMGIGDSENNEAWEWFLYKLSGAIGHISDLVIVSDRHPSILQAIPKVFPNALHGYCAFHMEMNLNQRFKNPDIIPLFRCCSRAYTRMEFDKYMADLNGIDPAITNYLIDVGIEKWSRHHFPGMRYGIMTTNISESFNNVMRAAREMPITMLAEYYRAKLQEWFVSRCQLGLKWESRYLTEDAEAKTASNRRKSLKFRVVRINAHIYQVIHGDSSDEVDLLNKKCTCKEFDIQKIPCSHAIAAARSEDIDVHSLVDKKYTAECYLIAYSEPIFPATDHGEWEVPKEIAELVNEPPNTKKKSGRQRKRRIRSRGEEIKKITLCSRCRKPGHNRATCCEVLQMIVEPIPSSFS